METEAGISHVNTCLRGEGGQAGAGRGRDQVWGCPTGPQPPQDSLPEDGTAPGTDWPVALGHCILSLTLLLSLWAVSHRIVERRTQLVLNKGSRCEKAFPGALSGHPSCAWGRDLRLTPPAPGTMPPQIYLLFLGAGPERAGGSSQGHTAQQGLIGSRHQAPAPPVLGSQQPLPSHSTS